MNDYLNKVIIIFKEIITKFEILYEIQKNLLDNYNIKNLNYEILYNIKALENNDYFKDLDKIIDNNVRINDILDIYKNFEKEEKFKELNDLIKKDDIDENKNKEDEKETKKKNFWVVVVVTKTIKSL